jgi:hypothetical protein
MRMVPKRSAIVCLLCFMYLAGDLSMRREPASASQFVHAAGAPFYDSGRDECVQ